VPLRGAQPLRPPARGRLHGDARRARARRRLPGAGRVDEVPVEPRAEVGLRGLARRLRARRRDPPLPALTLPVTEPSLDDVVAVVTGASRGIGEAVAVALAERGANVLLVARGEDGLARVAARIEEAGGACS